MEHAERFVIGLERNAKWVAVFAAVSEREAGGVRKARGCSVDDFGDQCERLQGAWAEAFDEEKRCEITEFLLVGNGQHRAQTLEIDVGRAHVVVRGHDELPGLLKGRLNRLTADREEGALSRHGAGVDEVENGALGLADDGGVRL